MDKTIRALTELSSIDRLVREKNGAPDAVTKKLEEQRAALRRQISGLLLAAYDVLTRARRYPPIVEMRGGYCGGCNLRLPPQLDNQVRGEKNLFACPHCHRLLYCLGRQAKRS